MTIYLDVVFLENVCMNSIILFATGLVTKTKCKIMRNLISSILGATYVVGAYMTNNIIYKNSLVKIGLSIAMIYIAFYPKNFKLIFKYIVIFYLTSFVFGGCAYALLYYIKPQDIFYRNGTFIGTYPIKITFLGAILGFITLNIAFKLIKNRLKKSEMFCNVNIGYNGEKIRIKAIIDSGNLLQDPITGSSVIVVEKKELVNVIDNSILNNLQNIILGKYEITDQEYISRFRLIPFSSIGKQNGMLIGFKPDWVSIEFDDIQKEMDKVIIAIYDKDISKNHEYAGIVGLETLEERSELNYEHTSNIKA